MRKVLIFILFFTSIQLTAQNWTMVLDSCYNREIFCFGSDTVYVGGGSHYLMVSYNAGNSWSKLPSPSLQKVFFLNSKIGYGSNLINNTLCKTTNGGLTWDSIFHFSDDLTYYSIIHFLNNDTGFISNNFNLFKTTDGGLHWNICFNIGVDAFGYINDSTYIIASDYIYKSIDWGNTWVVKENNPGIYRFFKVNDTVIYAGDLYRSMDAGETWEERNSGCAGYPQGGIYFFNKDSGFVCGNDMPGGCIYYTTDGGLSINSFSVDGNSDTFFDVCFIPNTCIGYLIGYNKLYKNTECWGPTKLPEIKDQEINVIYYNKETNSLEIKNADNDYILLELFNIIGEPVYKSKISNSIGLLGNLPKDLYLARLTTNKYQTITNKILIY